MKDASDPFANTYAASRQEAESAEARHVNPLDAAYAKAEAAAADLASILDACLEPGASTFGSITFRSRKEEDREDPTISVLATSTGPVRLAITTDVIALTNPPVGEPILVPQMLKIEMRDPDERQAEREIAWAMDVTGSVTITPDSLTTVLNEILAELR